MEIYAPPFWPTVHSFGTLYANGLCSMRLTLLLPLLITAVGCFSQNGLPQIAQGDSVTLVATVNLKNATKEGVYMEGYVVNIEYGELKRLDGKTIKVSGIVTLLSPIQDGAEKTDAGEEALVEQGRSQPIGYNEHPAVAVLKN